MDISSITSRMGYQPTQQPRPFQALGAALKSGDLAGAQTAFAQLTSQKSAGGQPTGSASQNDNFQALSQALSSGDITAAQKAFQAMSVKGAHRHHGGGPKPAQSVDDASANSKSILQMLTGSSTINLTA